MLCNNCRAENAEPLGFCRHCGAALAAGQRIWSFGRDPASAIPVTSADVSWHHGRLMEHNGIYVLEDLQSAGGTYVRGRRIFAPLRVERGEPIRLGSNTMLPWPGSESKAPVRRIGSHPMNDIVLDVPGVSKWHARIVFEAGQAIIEDLGSERGTSIQTIGNRILRSPLEAGSAVFFGSYRVLADQLLQPQKLSRGAQVAAPNVTTGPGATAAGNSMLVGRDPQCAFPIDHPSVSWHHAEIRPSGAAWQIRDKGSLHGTFVNGKLITGWERVKPGANIAIGTVLLEVEPSGQLRAVNYAQGFRIDLIDVEAQFLNPVSLTILPAELTAIMGPSGAGKTTLLQLLNGSILPTKGQLVMNGRDYATHRDEFRVQIGYVPQDDILHSQLTVMETLLFVGRLRTELSGAQLLARAEEVLADLQLTHVRSSLVGSVEQKRLSGGERKRVNIAIELLSKPPLLLMDEPTSGLSSEDAEGVVRQLRKLATNGNSVILTIHQPSTEIFTCFDCLTVIGRDRPEPGRLTYFGPAYPDSLEFFNEKAVQECRSRSVSPRPELLLKGLDSRPAREWESLYTGSKHHISHVQQRSLGATPVPARKSRARRSYFRQIYPLLHRNALTKLRDRGQWLTFALQAPIIGGLIAFSSGGLEDPTSNFTDFKEWRQYVGRIASTHFMLVVAAVWFGCNNAAREIVGEWAIYKRERMVNLSIPAYITSKFLLLALVAAIQSLILMMIAAAVGVLVPITAGWAVLTLISITGAAAGLCISAARRTTEQAIALLPIILLPVILFGGGLRPLHESSEGVRLIASLMPTRWAFEANLVEDACARTAKFQPPAVTPTPTVPVSNCPVADTHFPDSPDPRAGWARCVTYLVAEASFFLLLAGLILRVRDSLAAARILSRIRRALRLSG
ncbi:MAG: FHA domain-containing protein [Bryobacterales bacterium]|nr:FHA domain-containing protein [Bryobacterales bacterium]